MTKVIVVARYVINVSLSQNTIISKNANDQKIKNDISSEQDEILWTELHLPKTKKPIIVGTCYRPPKQNDFVDQFENNLSKLRSDCDIIILGDFNICLQQKTSSLFKAYSNLLRMFSLQQIIGEPTRITSTSKSLIDHILCNNQNNIVQSGTISIGLSDHFLTFCTRKATRGVFNTHKTVKIRSLKHYSKDDFILKLKNADWNVFYNCTCVNTAGTNFKTFCCQV